MEDFQKKQVGAFMSRDKKHEIGKETGENIWLLFIMTSN